MWSSEREKISSDPVAGRVRGMVVGQGFVQTENTVRHTKHGRIRGMVIGEGGRSTGVLLLDVFSLFNIMQLLQCCKCFRTQ